MQIELGPCLLEQRLAERGMSKEKLAAELRIRPERIVDYIDNKRMMPLKTAIAIADIVECNVRDLYELRRLM
jgi:DNA-binding XRE family transcriptional regulator